MTNPWRALLPAVLATAACVGPDIDYGEVRTFEVQRLEPSPYRVVAGDALSIVFTYHRDRNMQVTVRPDGRLTIPFAEEVQAAGRTVEELDAELTRLVNQHLRDPDLSVIVMSPAQQRIYVGGEVRRPGEVALVPGMTLHQALAAAGWTLPTAADDSVIVIRALQDGKRQAVKIDCSEEALIAYDVQLQGFDLVYVPKTTIARLGRFVDEYLNNSMPRWLTQFGVVYAIRETAN